MSAFLSPIFGAGAQLFSNAGIPLSGGKIYTYLAGTTAPLATWTDSTQIITNANPIILDSAGRPLNEMWLQSGSLYKFILTDANDNILGTWDNIAGLNDITATIAVSEWVTTGLLPSYINTTTFSVSGNNTATFVLNRRVKLAVSAGTVYGYVVSSSFGGGVTTVVIVPDSTVLDSGVSAVSVGILNTVNPSYPQQLLAMNAPVTVPSAPTTPIGAALSANVIVSGVVTITAFDTVLAGVLRLVKFSGILTLTYNATSLILPGAANITTAAGDQAIFRSLGAGNWECVNYMTASWTVLNAINATTATNQSGGTVNATTISASGQITSTVATGTAPLVVASTTLVANLHAATADTAANWSGTGAINGTTITGTNTVRGNTAAGLNTSAAVVGVASTSGDAVYGVSVSGNGLTGVSTSSGGVYGTTSSGVGVYGYSSSNVGVYGNSATGHGLTCLTASTTKSAFQIWPQNSQPTGPNVIGDMYVTAAGVLTICTVAGSPGTWVSVVAQV